VTVTPEPLSSTTPVPATPQQPNSVNLAALYTGYNPLLLTNLVQSLRSQAVSSTTPISSSAPSSTYQFLNNMPPLELANLINNPSNPVASLMEAAKSYQLDTEARTANKKSTQNDKPLIVEGMAAGAQSQFLQAMLDNVNRLKQQLQLQLMSNTSANLPKTSSEQTSTGDQQQQKTGAASRTVAQQSPPSSDNDEEDSETRGGGAPSTMRQPLMLLVVEMLANLD